MSHLQHEGGVIGVNQNDPQVCPLAHATATSSHEGLADAAMADHPHPCPYTDKITASPTTARVLLMFLRDFVELRTTYAQWTQSCLCPMMKCPQSFSEPLSLLEHLLSCPELPKGEFKCWKCSNSHGFPTNSEKEWAGAGVQRKRSLSHKLKETFAQGLSRRGSMSKVGPNVCQKHHGSGMAPEWAQFQEAHFRQQLDPNGQLDVRLGPGVCQPPSACGLPCVFNNLQTALRAEQMDMSEYTDCPTPTTDCSKHDQGTAWAEMDSISMCGLSSHTASTIYDSGPATDSANTSPQDSILFLAQNQFSPQLVQHDGSLLASPQFLNAPQFHGQSPLPGTGVDEIFISSPVDPSETHPWWGMPTVAPGVSPQAAGYGPAAFVTQPPADMTAPAVHMSLPGTVPTPVSAAEMSISSSHASSYEMEQSHNSPYGQPRRMPYPAQPTPDPRLYEPELQAFSPQPEQPMDQQSVDDGSEELVCEFCNWKPRGVRDNRKGYLRKHKNTHKNLRFPCTVEGCNKDFGRLDNLKAHMRDKHPNEPTPAKSEPKVAVEETMAPPPPQQLPPTTSSSAEESMIGIEAGQKRRRDSSEQFRGPLPQHSVLWSFNMG